MAKSDDPAAPRLSELEACVLGLVWSEGPCTAYQVHRTLKASPSPHWSGSAGAIYPVFRRLEERALLLTRPVRRGRREGKECRLSPAGRRALREWLGPPLPGWVVSLPIDPLRTRLRFLGALSPSRRRTFLAEARAAVAADIATIEADCRRLRTADDPFPHAMARGALHLARARRAWLEEVAGAIDGD